MKFLIHVVTLNLDFKISQMYFLDDFLLYIRGDSAQFVPVVSNAGLVGMLKANKYYMYCK